MRQRCWSEIKLTRAVLEPNSFCSVRVQVWLEKVEQLKLMWREKMRRLWHFYPRNEIKKFCVMFLAPAPRILLAQCQTSSDVSWMVKWHNTKWYGIKWHGIKWHGIKWHGTKWPGTKWQGTKWLNIKWPRVKWPRVKWPRVKWLGIKWPRVKWPSLKRPRVWWPREHQKA